MTELKETETGGLVVIKEIDIPALFKKDGCNPIIEGLKKKAAEFKGDISTKKGRDEIKSFARKFSTSKVYIDKLGKALTDKLRDEIAPIQAERNKIEACCDELRDKVRKPLTDYENAEKKRVADIEARVVAFDTYKDRTEFANSDEVEKVLKELRAIIVDETFEEFELAATKAKDAAVTQLEAKLIVIRNDEMKAAEAERLEKERLEKEREEREKKIAEDAAEAAKKEAEDKAKAEAGEKDRLAKEAIEKAERETLEAKLATERAEREKKEAAELAEKEKAEAIETEKRRQAAVVESERVEKEKLAANKAHRGKINRAAKKSLTEEGYSEDEAEKFIKLIAQGKIANITINY